MIVLTALVAALNSSGEAPYARLASDLGTPKLVRSTGTADKSQLDLHFVRDGETYTTWTKMTNVSILRVKAAETTGALLSVISRLKARLRSEHADIITFDRSLEPKTGAYYHVTGGNENDVGVVYSPAPGFVTVLSVGQTGTARDVASIADTLIKVAGIRP